MRATADECTNPEATPAEPVSPRIRALEALIEASLDDLERPEGHRSATGEGLLFIGNWNDALPRLLIHDPVLEPVDKIVWAVIKTCTDPRRGTAFPNYATIARLANVSAEGTVTRALAILRVTRWLTLCGRARDGRGRFRGSVYALHDEPLSLVDTLHLDAAYMEFTSKAATHHHARVSRVASGVIRSLELDLAENRAIESTPDPVLARIEAQQLIHSQQPEPGALSRSRSAVFSRSFATRFEVLPTPTPAPDLFEPESRPSPKTDSDQPQNMKAVIPRLLQKIETARHLQNLKPAESQAPQPQILSPQILRSSPDPHSGSSSSSSSSSKETTTTTTTSNRVAEENPLCGRETDSSEPTAVGEEPAAALALYRWPVWLDPNGRHLAVLELRRAPAPLRQTVLDLLDQRRRDGEAVIANRLHHPIQYLRSLCQLAAIGKIVQRKEPSALADAPEVQGTDREHLKQRLQVADGDYRHWLRLIGLTDDPKRKREWQALADQAKREIDQYRAALDSAIDAESRA